MNKVDPIRDREDVQKFKQAAKRKRDEVLVEIGMNCGLRISDLLDIQVKDITGNLHINISEQKTGKARKVKLNSKVEELVREYIEESGLEDDNYLFQSRQGGNRPISREQAYRILNDMADRAGLDIKVVIH